MRTTLILALASAALGLTAMANSSTVKEKTKISIIHCEGNEIQVHDTIVDTESGYTARQFIQAKGFDAEKVEIIHTQGYQGLVTHPVQPDVWFMNGNVVTENYAYEAASDSPGQEKTFMKKIVIEGEPDTAGDTQKQIVLIDSYRELMSGDSALSNHVFRFHNSNFEINLDSLVLKANKTNDAPGTSQKMEVKKTINDDGDEETRIWIDGKEVSHTIRGKGEGNAEFFINQCSLKEFKPSEMSEGPDAIQKMDLSTIKPSYLPMFNASGENAPLKPLTIVLVTPMPDQTDEPEEPTGIQNEYKQIEDLRFFPNPSEGKFRLSFNVLQEGRTGVSIYSIEGKKLYAEDLGRFSGTYEEEIDISHLGPGTYILNVTIDNNRIAEKLIVQ